MSEWMTAERQEALQAICDTVVPAIERAERSGRLLGADRDGHRRRRGASSS